jgi:Ca-activated chloride channel homolog
VTLLAPWGLLGLAVVVPLVVAHLRRRRSTRAVASLLLWPQPERRAVTARRRAVLVLPWLLALQVLAVAALAVALARPEHDDGGGAAARAPVAVFVVDTSLAMRPADRLPAARAAVESRLAALPQGTRAALVAPDVLVAPTTDRKKLRTALARLRAGYGTADLTTALRIAGGLLATPHDHVDVLHAREDPVPRTSGVAVTARAVGAPLADQAIDTAAARCAAADCRLHAVVRNDDDNGRTDVVEVRDGTRLLVRQAVHVAAHDQTGIVLRVRAGARLRVTIDGARDGLPEDDTASVVVPGPASAAVTLVSDAGRSSALTRALAAVPGVKLRLLTPAAFRHAGAGTADLLVLDRIAAPAQLPAVAGVLEVAPPSGAALADAAVTTTADDPLLAGVDLTGLAIDAGAAHRLTLPAGLRTVVGAAGGPLLAAGIAHGQRLAVLAFDPRRSTLPGLAAFPTLIANLVAWGGGSTTPTTQRAGSALAVPLPARRDIATLRLDRPGFRTITRAETVAVNPTPPGAATAGPAVQLRPPSTPVATGGRSERWRWLVALALAVLVAESLVARRSGLALGVRAGAAVALVVALIGPHVGGEAKRPVVLVLDRSASGGRAVAQAQARWVRECGGCRVVEFGSTQMSDLAAGIDAAAGLMARGGRVVVLGDGVPTTGDAAAAASRARARGIRVDGVRLAPTRVPDAAVVRVHAPAAVRAGDPFALELTIRSAAAATVRLTVTRDGGAGGAQDVRVRAGDTALTVDERAPAAGWHRYRVAVALDGDQRAANDAMDAVVRVAAAPRVLVVEGAPGRAGGLPGALRATGADVRIASALPASAAELEQQDAVVLADVPARDVDAAQTAALTTAVRTGGLGLLALGGPHSLSLGGGSAAPLDALLPTRSLQPGGLKRTLALELVLDRSSSMADLAGTQPKIDLARQAARAALTVAGTNQDEYGVVAFDARAHAIVPRTRIATDADASSAAGLLDGLDADGGTSVAAGLTAGAAELAASKAPAKHIILLSDGVSQPFDATRILARVRAAGATLSTVALGQDADRPLLRRLARLGGGRFLDAPGGAALPKIFADEARRSVPSVAVRGRVAVTPSAPSSLLASLTADRTLPDLAGLVVTGLRPGAQAPLVSRLQGRVVPVLAQWQTGLGRAVTWTPGAGDWAGRWLQDDATVLTDAVRWTARAVPARPLQPTLAAGEPRQAVIDPLATAGTALDLAAPTGTVTPAGGGTPRALTFTQDAPSHYTATLPTAARAQVDVLDIDGQQTQLAIPYPAEDVPVTPQSSVLGQLAELTGGRLIPATADPATALHQPDGTALWPFLIAIALALLLTAAALDTRRAA